MIKDLQNSENNMTDQASVGFAIVRVLYKWTIENKST